MVAAQVHEVHIVLRAVEDAFEHREVFRSQNRVLTRCPIVKMLDAGRKLCIVGVGGREDIDPDVVKVNAKLAVLQGTLHQALTRLIRVIPGLLQEVH